MDAIFECTLEMINKDFHEYPEFRVEFFKLLQAINLFCFPALLKLGWPAIQVCHRLLHVGMQTRQPRGREHRLAMCLELINNMAETDAQTAGIFFQQFYISILQDVLFVLTDSDHKAGFKSQCMLLGTDVPACRDEQDLAALVPIRPGCPGHFQQAVCQRVHVESPAARLPQSEGDAGPALRHRSLRLNEDATKFKTHVRDFLISLKEFADDNAELYAKSVSKRRKISLTQNANEDMKVGGLIKPADLDGDDEL